MKHLFYLTSSFGWIIIGYNLYYIVWPVDKFYAISAIVGCVSAISNNVKTQLEDKPCSDR